MSGRTRHLRDGELITNRKTDRRQSPARPLKERLQEIALKGAGAAESRVRMAFVLPAALEGFISPGALDPGIEVLARGFVRITSWSAEKCFSRAQAFFRDVARDKAGFTLQAVILNTQNPGEHYSRHLTVVRGAMVVSSGVHEPKVFEAA
jgi:hypothetical protein